MKRLAALAIAVTLATWLPGCDRAPRFRPAGPDSTGAVPADSGAIYVQMARAEWEDLEQGSTAAELTARIIVQDLRNRPTEPIAQRARNLVDSLSFGAETVGGPWFVVVNLFARSNPSAGSYPYLFWRDQDATRLQFLEAGGMHLVGAIEEARSDDQQASRLAVLYTRVGSAGQQPFVFVWQRPPGRATWRLAQSLGADSLGVVGTAHFVQPGPDGVVLVSRATIPTRGFDECATCPHVYRVKRLRWGEGGLVTVGEEIERSPYFAFVQFIQALESGDRGRAEGWVADPSLVDAADGFEWGRRKGLWRLAPASSPNAKDFVMFRGSQEAYRVHFGQRGGDWVVIGFEPTSRSLE
jgi:hypothetical protein